MAGVAGALMTWPGGTGTIEVVRAGMFTTVQDVPGRLGYWMVGVPPSGAMDDRSMRLANRIVGNAADAAGLECTVGGPTLRFTEPATVCLGGADMGARLDGRPMPCWSPFAVPAGGILALSSIIGPGMRTYVAIRGGIDATPVLGSRATFTLGGFGGHDGRQLAEGDVLAIGAATAGVIPSPLPPSCWPSLSGRWQIGVMEGPHAAPDFFTVEGVEELVSATWTVQAHAARTGVRLSGPSPQWARADGGDAGLHPSNIHDNGYAFGAVDFTGDTPVVLGPDGPSLGGFTCPLTVVAAERWKLGQLAPGDTVHFVIVDEERAAEARRATNHVAQRLRRSERSDRLAPTGRRDGGILVHEPGDGDERPEAAYRRAGDEFLLVEYGEMTLELGLRARIHALQSWLDDHQPDAIVDTTAGVRSLLVHFDPDMLPVGELLDLVRKGDDELPATSELVIPSRTVHLPLSWEDPATLEAIRRYMAVVRDDAPWCPSNLEFIRRINGLDDVDDVHRIVFDARYLVLGLGDVYLGAPVATPVDPRHRLVTTKYNPARTWTPENAVGIGGAYLCVYGMEGPGGYQFVGRTVPVWYLDQPTPGDDPGTPWLLRTFDQLRFHPVSADELLDLREHARAGELEIEIEDGTFSLAEHETWLTVEADEIDAFRAQQQDAFDAERRRWIISGELR